jgi:hypothetical protein
MPTNSGLSLPMKIALLVSIFMCVGVGLYFFMEGNRYSIVKDGAGDLYKIDRRTGRTWKLVGVYSVEVRDFGQGGTAEAPDKQAIRLAQNYGANPTGQPSMDVIIQETLRGMKGPLSIAGWTAKKVDDEVYVVAYLYDTGPNTQASGWVFEVNLKAQIVRRIDGDPELERKYAAGMKSVPTQK